MSWPLSIFSFRELHLPRRCSIEAPVEDFGLGVPDIASLDRIMGVSW
jgi:hypothetical protein